MDQVKQVLAVLNAQKFWVACGFLTLLPIGAWFMAKSTLDNDLKTRKTAIDSAYSTAESISKIPDHPNPISAKGMDENIGKLKKSVFDAWQAQYEEQKQILVWPSELRPDFIAKVDRLRPIEETMTFPTPPANELRLEYREEYRDYIKDELPKLAKVIGAQWRGGAAQGGGSGYGGSGAMGYGADTANTIARSSDAGKVIVQWDAGDQSRLISQFDWSHTQDKLPQTLDILYAQEDLWILNAVMNIIKRTNRDATASYDATIKELKYVQLGQAVRGAVGNVQRLTGAVSGAGASGGGVYESMGGSDMMSSGGADLGMGSGAGGGETSPSRDPADLRYVDVDYVPLSASRVRTALSPEGKSPDDAFLVVAKRIPIRLGLTMDQRRIHRLVTECGNSTLRVEVRQVRVNRQSAPGGGGASGGATAGGGGGFGSGFGGGFGEGAEDYGSGGATAAASIKSSYDLPVELYGIIYIYNPVAERKLGIELKEADPDAVPAAPEPVAAEKALAPAEMDVAAN